MAKKHLGETIDIHGGGMDLKFPHHESEICQSESLHGNTFANYWMHVGLLTVEGEKMSKSIGNVVLVKDAVDSYDKDSLRYFYLSSHYRSQVDYSKENMEQAQTAIAYFKRTISNLLHYAENALQNSADTGIEQSISELKTKFVDALSDDFNTANAITVLFELSQRANAEMQHLSSNDALLYANTLVELGSILGFSLSPTANTLEEEIQALILERNEARKAKNFKRSDEIREQLKNKGIILEDTPHGTRWSKAEQ
jgi:cysteinyl-tRNA synthetase